MYGNHSLRFDRFGEELEANYDGIRVMEDRIDLIDKVRNTFDFTSTYVSFKTRRLVSVAPAIHSNDCVIKENLRI